MFQQYVANLTCSAGVRWNGPNSIFIASILVGTIRNSYRYDFDRSYCESVSEESYYCNFNHSSNQFNLMQNIIFVQTEL